MLVFWQGSLLAQDENTGSIAGEVSDSWSNGKLGKVVVSIRGTTLGGVTDSLGRYRVDGVAPGNYVVVFSRSGYVRKSVENVRVAIGQATPADMTLKPEFYTAETYENISEPPDDNNGGVVQLLDDKKSANEFKDSIGSEQFSALGIDDAGEAVSKVTGVTVTGGKFAVVRGLSDRYTLALLNGAIIPSADSEKQAAQLDLFPAEMIAKVDVSKTFTPDQPGGFTGGAINIVTKTFPDRPIYKVSGSTSFNSNNNLRDDFFTYPGGKRDFLGLDDGTRALPEALEERIRSSVEGDVRIDQALRNGGWTSADRAALAASFGDNVFGPTRRYSPVNYGFATTVGDGYNLLGMESGFLASVNFDRSFTLRKDNPNTKLDFSQNGNISGTPIRDLRETAGTESAVWGASMATGFKIGENSEIGFTFLHTQNTDDTVRELRGFTENNADAYIYSIDYNQRALRMYQVRGNHVFPEAGFLEVDWTTSLAQTSQYQPDLRGMAFRRSGGIYSFDPSGFSPFGLPTRVFRDIDESNVNNKLDFKLPFYQWEGEEGFLKFGMAQSRSERDYLQVSFRTVQEEEIPPILPGFPPIIRQTPPQSGDPNDMTNVRLTGAGPDNKKYSGNVDVDGIYLMTDLPINSRLKLIGGARLEKTYISVTGKDLTGASFQPATIQQNDILPALGMVVSPITNVNVRLHWSKTVARPIYREIADLRTFEFAGGDELFGNPDLGMSAIDNYDFRVEWFPRPGEVISSSLFYKTISDPIELVQFNAGGSFRFVNSKSAEVMGVEFEARKQLDFISNVFTNFNAGFNFAYIKSEVPVDPTVQANKGVFAEEKRPLFDQSPHIINADLTYDNRRIGTMVTLSYSVFGRRLLAENLGGPDIYEDPAPILSASITQALGRNRRWKLKVSANNILNPVNRRSYDEETFERGNNLGNLQPYERSFTRGISFGFSASYSY